MDSRMNVASGGTASACPVLRSSRTTTSCPASSSIRVTTLPIYPAPPVTSNFTRSLLAWRSGRPGRPPAVRVGGDTPSGASGRIDHPTWPSRIACAAMRGDGGAGRPAGRRRRQPGPLARGVARVMVRAADATIRMVTALLGASPADGRERISEAELRDLVAANTRLDPVERHIIDEVLVAGARSVREVMRPRTEVVFLSAGLTLDEAARLVRVDTHTRYPVTDGTHDDVIGFVHLRDVLLRPEGEGKRTVGELVREVKRLPGSKRVLAALTEMRREGQHLAVVV